MNETIRTYRRKQSIVTASQWFPRPNSPYVFNELFTSAGSFVVRPGDWIVEANGQKWIVEYDLFDLLYEPIEEHE